jgi:TPR repeat protein
MMKYRESVGEYLSKFDECTVADDRVCKCEKKISNKAFKYCKKLVNEGNTCAMIVLGNFYHYGRHAPYTSQGKAYELYKRSADKNNSDGIYKLGMCYAKAIGVDEDGDKAVELLTKAANLENVNAIHKLGRWYELELHVNCDFERAYELYKKASDLGSIPASLRLAQWYREGIHVKKNSEKAFIIFEKMAKRNDVSAIEELAECYEKGIGVKKNTSKAILLHMKLYKRDTVILIEKINKLVMEYSHFEINDIKIPYFKDIGSQCTICFKTDVRRAIVRCKCKLNSKICCGCFLDLCTKNNPVCNFCGFGMFE